MEKIASHATQKSSLLCPLDVILAHDQSLGFLGKSGENRGDKIRDDIFLTLNIPNPLRHLHPPCDISLRPGSTRKKHN